MRHIGGPQEPDPIKNTGGTRQEGQQRSSDETQLVKEIRDETIFGKFYGWTEPFMMIKSSLGRSDASVCTCPILFTTGMPE